MSSIGIDLFIKQTSRTSQREQWSITSNWQCFELVVAWKSYLVCFGWIIWSFNPVKYITGTRSWWTLSIDFIPTEKTFDGNNQAMADRADAASLNYSINRNQQ